MELIIPIREYIGQSQWNWETGEFEWATSIDDVKMLFEYAAYAGQAVTSILVEIGKCYGGSTFDGKEIYHYLQNTGLPIRTRILSFAGSMGSVIPLAGEEIEMEASAQILVHGPSGGADGTVEQMTSGLKLLTNERQALHDIYVARTGQPTEVVQEWMSKDTFFTAAEALAAGLVTKVIPLAPRNAAVLNNVQASARRAKYAGIVARAEKRAAVRAAVPKPKVKSAAAPAPTTPRPMAKKVITAGAAVARRPTTAAAPAAKPAAAKPAALNANQKAVAAFAKQLGVTIKMEGDATAEVEETTAEVVETVLVDGAGSLFSDGELAVDSAVFNDEALSVATADGTYETEAGQDVTIAGGVVTEITDVEAEAEESPVITALMAKLDTLTAQVEKFSKAVPPTPRAKGTVQTPDPKTPVPKAKGVLKGASTPR